ncbi:MAG TPA: hypothetical protein VN088_02420 [Nocardioides sp.]|nr:hypothetical protein [Nocardioides sp.]
MSVVDTVVRLTRHVASRTAHAIVHPVETATGVADLAGSAASAAAGVVTGTKDETGDTGPTEPTASTSTTGAPPEALLFPPEPAPAAPPVATEPKPADIDDWQDELDDADDEVPPPAQPDDDRPLLDPSVAKAVRHESETMRRAAERDPESATGSH